MIVIDVNSSHLSKNIMGAVLEIEFPVFFFKITDFSTEPAAPGVINIDKLEKLWTEEGIQSIECKQIKVSRSFKNFEEFWNINASVQAVTTVLDELSPQTVIEIRSNVERELDYDSNGSVVVHGHANAIKGIV